MNHVIGWESGRKGHSRLPRITVRKSLERKKHTTSRYAYRIEERSCGKRVLSLSLPGFNAYSRAGRKCNFFLIKYHAVFVSSRAPETLVHANAMPAQYPLGHLGRVPEDKQSTTAYLSGYVYMTCHCDATYAGSLSAASIQLITSKYMCYGMMYSGVRYKPQSMQCMP